MVNDQQKTPLPNRGVPKLRYSLDWLRFSVSDVAAAEQFIDTLYTDGEDWERESIQCLPHYTDAFRFQHGRVDWHERRLEQRVLITMTGADLAGYISTGEDARTLLSAALAARGSKITRLDFAADYMDAPGTPESIKAAHDAGELQTSARHVTVVTSHIDGEQSGITVYIGSRQSGRMLRVYDKAKERGLNGVLWTRCELEAKHPMSGVIARAMVRHGVVRGGKLAMSEFASGGPAWYQDLIGGDETGYIEKAGRKVTDWEKWVRKVVVPNAERAIRQGVPGVRAVLLDAILEFDDKGAHGPRG